MKLNNQYQLSVMRRFLTDEELRDFHKKYLDARKDTYLKTRFTYSREDVQLTYQYMSGSLTLKD